MEHSRFSPFRLLWPALAVLGGLVLVAATMGAAQAFSANPIGALDAPGAIEGFLYEPDGTTAVNDGWIDIHDAAGQPWMGAHTDASGHFVIPNLPPGEYILHAHPPPGNPYAASPPTVVQVLSGQVVPTTLYLTEVRISGYVRDCDAVPELRIEGALVVAHNGDWTIERWAATDANGEFKIGGLEVGTSYILEVLPPHESEYALMEPIAVVPISTNMVLELCIPPANVVGVVEDYTGAPVPGAGVVVFHDDFWRETAANEFGEFTFRGLPVGEFTVQASPPWGAHGAGLLPSAPAHASIAQHDTLVDVGVLTLPQAFKTVRGEVLNAATGTGVDDAVVHAHRLDRPGYADTPVDPSGAFTLSLAGGEWHLGVSPLNPPATWVFPGPPAWIVFEKPPTEIEEISAVMLEVIPTNAWVEGQVLCPGDPGPVPCAGIVPYEDIQVEVRNDDIGNSAGLRPDYSFEIPIPDGWYELVVHVAHPELQGPAPVPVYAGPGQGVNVNVVLLAKDARIVGQVHNEFGVGVEGVLVVGWQAEGFGCGRAETDASGAYVMPVIGGEWLVEPQPGPELPYVFNQRPRLARVVPGGTMAGVDFMLSRGDAHIEGAAVDANSQERIWGLDGWAWAERIVPPPGEPVFYSDAPMWDGGFELKVTGDEAYWVGVGVPPRAPFVSGSTGPVPVPPAGHVSVEVPMEHKDAVIEGALIIAGSSPPERAHDVWAEVFGEDEHGHWATIGVDPDSAWYELSVISGTWHMRAWVDPESGYVAIPTTTVVTVQSGQVASFVNFEVWPIEASIRGQVLRPDGTPLAGAFVFAEGESPHVGYFEAHAESDASGNFELIVPEGGYVVGAALPGDELEALGWLNPSPIDVPWVSTASPATGLELRFRELDGEIHGVVSFAPGLVLTAAHPAYIWGWSDTGEWMESEAHGITDTFTYAMGVVAGTVWHVGAVYEDRENGVFYESPEEVVDLTTVDQATQDLVLGGPWPLPQPFIISFDGSYMQTIVMPDGVELTIPPGALVVSGTVTLFVFPTYEMVPQPGREVIGPGYEMWAVDENGREITRFNQNVMMTFGYPPDAVLEAHGIAEHFLVPVYYSTLAGHWILAESYVVDTVHNEITLQINHFTKFGVASTEPREYHLYLPIVLRSAP
jgi:hypothetical protein